MAYLAGSSPTAAQRLLEDGLTDAASLDVLSERGRRVPEWNLPTVREIFVGRYRLIYHVADDTVTIIGFIHGARDLRILQREPDPDS